MFKASKRLAEAPPTDLELTHYRQHVPRLEKNNKKWKNREKIWGIGDGPKKGGVFAKNQLKNAVL